MPQNLVDTVVALRQLMAAYYDASLALEQHFDDPAIEALAAEVRPECSIAAGGVYKLLEALEQTKQYQQLRRAHLEALASKRK